MSKEPTKEYIQSEIDEMQMYNEQIKSAALMVGYDVDKATEQALESMDKRIRVNLHQTTWIKALQSLLREQPND